MHARVVFLMMAGWAACLAPLAGGCSTNPATGETQLMLISREQEIQIGEEAAPQFEEEFGGEVPNQTLQSYVSSVGQQVARNSDRDMPYEFTLVRSDVPNAFALPGGKIFITAGLMSKMNNERELAAVLGHEIAHVAARHNVAGIQRQMGVQVFAQVLGSIVGGDAGAAAEAAASVVGAMSNLKYSRGAEHEADLIGMRYMQRAGYNPWGMIELLKVLQSLSEGGESKVANIFQTHPLTSERINQAEADFSSKYASYSATAADPNARRFNDMRNLLMRTMGW